MTGIVQSLIGSFGSVVSAATDAYFYLVTLLLPGNGTNGAQNNTFLDSSTNNFTITRNGNTTQGTFSPFSQTGWSNYFSGSSDYISAPSNAAFGFGTGDFTIEGWCYIPNTTGVKVLFDSRITSNTNGIAIYANGATINAANGASQIISGGTLSANTWFHVALVRNGTGTNGTTLYLNGASVGSATVSTSFNTTSCYIGNSYLNEYYSGYISNFRVVKGTAVYTAAFTPPTSALTAITNTSLLTCQDNRFRDASSNAFAITVNGTPSVQAFSPFAPTAAYSAATNGGSGYFDGTGDYLTAADNAALDVSSGDFTVECWFYANGVTAEQPIVSRNNGSISTGSNIQYNIFVLSGSARVRPYSGTTDYTINVGTVVPNAWNHIALVRTGNTFYGYLNGTRSATTQTITGSLNTGTWSTYIGGALISGGGNLFFNGYCGGVRVTKGGALYTGATYTVPTSPFTTTVSAGTANLLINFTNAGITDATAKNDLETVGNAQISTTQSKFGGSSMYFDGTGDYLLIPSSNVNRPLFDFGSGNWTVEFWVNWTTAPSATTEFRLWWSSVRSTGVARLDLYIYNNIVYAGWSGTNVLDSGSLSWNTGQWYHMAFVRSGNSWAAFRDGTRIASATNSTTLVSSPAKIIGENVNAYIDDFRVTTGYARYDPSQTTVTIPTAAFALQ